MNEADVEDDLSFLNSQIVVLAFQHKVCDGMKFIYSFRKIETLEDPILTEPRTSTFQVPQTPQQQQEHRPLGVRLDLFYLKQLMDDAGEMLVLAFDNKRPLFWEVKKSREEMKLVKLGQNVIKRKSGDVRSMQL